MSEGVLVVDEAGKIVMANLIAEQMFGYLNDELSDEPLENLLPERYRGRHMMFRKGFNSNPEPRRMGLGRDLTALRKDGSEFPIEISLSFTKLKGKLLVMAFISDISKRKQAEDAVKRSEEQLAVYAAELERKVRARTEALNKTIAELEREVQERKRAEEEAKNALEKERELNELKTKFVSIASHEFRTPLSTVMSSASLIQQYKDRDDLSKIDKHIARIKSTVVHLTTILNDFLSLGKLEEGRIEVNHEQIAPENLLTEVCEEMTPILKDGQTINIDCKAKNISIQTDSRILRSIFLNLISNASKYSDADKPIHISCRCENDMVIFDVRDEGIGIPEPEQKHLFQRFYRASNAGNIQGTGLGLNIVKRYIDLLQGDIAFVSKAGRGTTFTISIPVKTT